ncbi:hypothetical protein SDC9_106872 [bioreactor metagenome]|uniref:Uncharacterized protein n=1 Tax=bioreactor metagenome TaxID=1076179 RepID=A0A645B3L9_9ZZZZ
MLLHQGDQIFIAEGQRRDDIYRVRLEALGKQLLQVVRGGSRGCLLALLRFEGYDVFAALQLHRGNLVVHNELLEFVVLQLLGFRAGVHGGKLVYKNGEYQRPYDNGDDAHIILIVV